MVSIKNIYMFFLIVFSCASMQTVLADTRTTDLIWRDGRLIKRTIITKSPRYYSHPRPYYSSCDDENVFFAAGLAACIVGIIAIDALLKPKEDKIIIIEEEVIY